MTDATSGCISREYTEIKVKDYLLKSNARFPHEIVHHSLSDINSLISGELILWVAKLEFSMATLDIL